jgi:glycosyltransferase involved in cell wall biosynthesis
MAGSLVPLVSVVVPTFNRRGQLATVIDALLADAATAELIVVVDGSTDGSLEWLRDRAARDPRLRPLWTPNRGELAARELGLASARHPVVLFVDDDVVAGPGLVSGHAAHHATHPALAVLGPMPVPERVLAGGGVPARLYATWYEQQVDAYKRQPEEILRSLWAGNLSLPRDAARRVGLANPAFDARYNGDREFGLRLLRAGLEGRFDPALRAEHLYERSRARFLSDAEATGEGTWLVHELHGDLLGPFPMDDFAEYLSGSMAAAVRLSLRPRGRPLVTVASKLAAVAGALGLSAVEERALTAAFHMVRLRAALERSRRRPYYPGS